MTTILKTIEENKSDFEEKILSKLFSHNTDMHLLDMDSRGMRQRCMNMSSSSTLKLLQAVREEVGDENDIQKITTYETYTEGRLHGMREERQRFCSLLNEAITSITNNNE